MKKVLGLFLVLVLAIALSGCRDRTATWSGSGFQVQHDELENVLETHYYTQEEVDEMFREFEASLEEEYFDEIGDEFDKINDLIKICNNADTPDDIGGLGDTDCDEMIIWYSDNWEELYDLLEYMTDDDLFATDLKEYIEDTIE